MARASGGSEGGDVYNWLLLNADSINASTAGLHNTAEAFAHPDADLGLGATTGGFDGMVGDAQVDLWDSPAPALLPSPGHAAPPMTLPSPALGPERDVAMPPPSAAPVAPDVKPRLARKRAPGKAGAQAAPAPVAEQRKRSRLEKNRESARESRRRKREHLTNMERRVRELEQETRELRLQLKMGRESREQEEAEKAAVCKQLADMVESGTSEGDIASTIRAFGDRYADYGQDRQRMVMYHLGQVERLLVPTDVTKMCMWSLHQPDEFYDDGEAEGEGSIWRILAEHLEVTPAQKQQIKDYRAHIRKRSSDLRRCMHLVRELKTASASKNQQLDSDMEALQSVLTPKQIAKFILWTDSNPACMHMLNQLWKATMSTPASQITGAAPAAAATGAGADADAGAGVGSAAAAGAGAVASTEAGVGVGPALTAPATDSGAAPPPAVPAPAPSTDSAPDSSSDGAGYRSGTLSTSGPASGGDGAGAAEEALAPPRTRRRSARRTQG